MPMETQSRHPVALVGEGEPPVLDTRALFVRAKSGAEIRAFAETLPDGINGVARNSPLLQYLDTHPAASMIALYPGLGERTINGENWSLALPVGPQHISALHHVAVANAHELAWLEATLANDPLVASFRQPVLQYPHASPVVAAEPPADKQWGLKVCGFRQVWQALDTGHPHPGTIAVMDQGNEAGHFELVGRLTMIPLPRLTPAAVSSHAGEVSAVIAARRDDGVGMDGCCSAHIELYNVCGPMGEPDSRAYPAALAAVAASTAQVLNISLGSAQRDPDLAQQIAHCIEKGVVVVVAMGNQGDAPFALFPTEEPNVIAVGATDPNGQRPKWASRGRQMFMAAPGQFIRTISGKSDFTDPSGTSYSAGMVTAAVWLMRRARKCLTVPEVRDILRRSVDTTFTGGMATPGLGYGQLDMVKLGLNLVQVPFCPP